MKHSVGSVLSQAGSLARGFVSIGLALSLSAACGSSDSDADKSSASKSGSASETAGASAAEAKSAAGTAAKSGQAAAANKSGTGGTGGGEAKASKPKASKPKADNDVPCDVAKVLQDHCLMCHDKVTQFGAPLSLASYDDLKAMSKTKPDVPVAELMLERVKDAQRPMPPQPMKGLSDEEIATLESWVKDGQSKADGSACSTDDEPTTPDADSGSKDRDETASADEDVQCYKFLANNAGEAKYDVPATPDLYQCFYFDAPWHQDGQRDDDIQGVSANYIVDNTRAIHHFILYSTTSTAAAKSNSACPTGAHPDGQFIAGWAPGATPIVMPKDVGIEVPGPRYLLETHYNAPEAGMQDASGIELCVTRKKRPNAAAVHPLGQEGFSSAGPTDVTGTCKPQGPFPIHIMYSNPHMHLKGTNMKFIVHRKDGSQEVLLDKPFDFMNQAMYDTPTVINEGDTLETVCSFNGAMQFGTGTNEEMCYNFVMAWPAGALGGGAGYHGLSNNGNICINSALGL